MEPTDFLDLTPDFQLYPLRQTYLISSQRNHGPWPHEQQLNIKGQSDGDEIPYRVQKVKANEESGYINIRTLHITSEF